MKLLLIPLSLLSLGTSALAEDPPSGPPPVRTVTPKKAMDTSSYEIPGRTEPIEQATIFTRATGIVRERDFEIGDVVRAGSVMAVVDAPEIDRAVEVASANVQQAIARATNDRKVSARSSELYRSDVVSAQDSEASQLTAVESEAGVRAARAELSRLQELQGFSTVRAPFEGIISARNFDRGDHVRGDSAGEDQWLYRLIRLDTLRFVISAPPDLALRIEGGDEAIVRFREFPGREFSARVAHFSRLFDTASGTMRVELLVENNDLALPAGLTGSARFQVKPSANSYLVPTNALLTRDGRTEIATERDGSVHFLAVSPGRNSGSEVEIMSDKLTESTPVILNPNAMLREGDPVKPSPLAVK